MPDSLSVVMIGATGAVGGHVVETLVGRDNLKQLTLLGRRPVEGVTSEVVRQHAIDIFDPSTYEAYLSGHRTAICTLGVGEPTKTSRHDLVKIDKTAVLDFATACKVAGVRHFELLGSVGSNSRSCSFFLRTKGELQDGLRALDFERLSLFQPSMILTPTNRYGLSQALTLAVWPYLTPVLAGGLRIYRGIRVDMLGRAIANNITKGKVGTEVLFWDDFMSLSGEKI